jgi:hypothetical protein
MYIGLSTSSNARLKMEGFGTTISLRPNIYTSGIRASQQART